MQDLDLAQLFAVNEGLSPAEALKAKYLMKQYMEIIEHCKQGSIKLTKIFMDSRSNKCFPVFSNDNLESILNRFARMYPLESACMVDQFKTDFEDNESGWTKGGSMKMSMRMPNLIKCCGMAISQDFWTSNNGANLRKFKELCPKLVTKERKAKWSGI